MVRFLTVSREECENIATTVLLLTWITLPAVSGR